MRRYYKYKKYHKEYDENEELILMSILSKYDQNTNMFQQLDIFLENQKPCYILSFSQKIKWNNFLKAAEQSINPINLLDLRNVLLLIIKKQLLIKKMLQQYKNTLAKRGCYYK